QPEEVSTNVAARQVNKIFIAVKVLLLGNGGIPGWHSRAAGAAACIIIAGWRRKHFIPLYVAICKSDIEPTEMRINLICACGGKQTAAPFLAPVNGSIIRIGV